jgi:hypothetical protein
VNNTELSFEICRLYCKKGCKYCHGRGYLTFNSPDPGAALLEWVDYCSCVKKKLARAMDAEAKLG